MTGQTWDSNSLHCSNISSREKMLLDEMADALQNCSDTSECRWKPISIPVKLKHPRTSVLQLQRSTSGVCHNQGVVRLQVSEALKRAREVQKLSLWVSNFCTLPETCGLCLSSMNLPWLPRSMSINCFDVLSDAANACSNVGMKFCHESTDSDLA